MGNDIRSVPPKDLAILSNAAVIAVNQDPNGGSASRRWMYNTNETDQNGKAAIQMWSGYLMSTTGGDWSDMVVVLVNGNDATTVMNATLVDIFIDSGGIKANEVKISWEVRDLWASRMSESEAAAIIAGSSATGNSTTGYNATSVASGRYNATRTSYADGLASNNTLLLGNVTTTVQPSGTITAAVDPHGAAMFRLRAIPTAMKKRDEL